MKSDVNLTELLNTYEIAQPDEAQITKCIQQSKQAVQIKKVRRDDTLWFFIETQLKFMRREIAVSFLLSLVVMLILQLSRFLSKTDNFFEIMVGGAPFLVVPIMLSIAKSKRNKMLELETASKFSLAKILAVRTIINQALAIIMLSLIWLFSSVSLKSFSMNGLLFSLISFEIAASCFLWFGKSSVKTGVFSVAGWTGIMLIFLSWKKAVIWMEAINSMALLLITMALIGISTMVLYGYVKKVSFESEEEKWNLGWTD